MKIRIESEPGNEKVFMQIKNLHKLNAKGIRRAFYDIGKDLKVTANKNILAKPRSGRKYKIRKGGRLITHVASRPGETPANLTGQLRKSLDFNVEGSDTLTFGYREGFPANPTTGFVPKGGVIYGKWLERGTAKMAARPGLKISVEQNQGNALEHFNTELKKALKKK